MPLVRSGNNIRQFVLEDLDEATSIDEVRDIPYPVDKEHVIVKLDLLTRIYKFDSSATDADDGVNFLDPTNTEVDGRWVRLLIDGGGSISALTSNIDGLVGGAVTDLDSIETVDLAEKQTITILHAGSGAYLEYVLEADALPENVPWVIRPDDYGAGNQKVWKLQTVTKDGAPALWNNDTSAFHMVVASGAAGFVTAAFEQTGFQITS